MTNYFILFDLVQKVQKSHAANREGTGAFTFSENTAYKGSGYNLPSKCISCRSLSGIWKVFEWYSAMKPLFEMASSMLRIIFILLQDEYRGAVGTLTSI